MRALVTGSYGVMGSEFKAELESRGFEVTGIDLKGYKGTNAVDFFASSRERFDLVVHASQAIMDNPREQRFNSWAVQNAVQDTMLWHWVNKTGHKKVIYLSSGQVYGDSSMYALEKDATGDGVIGGIKLTGEKLGRLSSAPGVTQFMFPRYFDVFGKSGFSSAIDNQCDVIREIRWGSTIRAKTSGEEMRDFMYVKDAVRITLDIFDTGRSGPINICSGVQRPYADFADLAIKTLGKPGMAIEFDKGIERPSRVGNNTLMLRYFLPRYSLQQALEEIREEF